MKNYLFEPFKNDEIKTYFNKLKNNLDIYGLTMFVGRLEAYYDVIISKLQAEKDELQDERNTLKYALENYQCGCKYPKELKADAEEYFENNPHETKLFYFVVGASGCEEDGDVINSDLWMRCGFPVATLAEFDNYDGIVSGEVFK
tara:strand:- start:51 stop:485 length:435 start_codon:yes stop_codon:yes gene_type:complete